MLERTRIIAIATAALAFSIAATAQTVETSVKNDVSPALSSVPVPALKAQAAFKKVHKVKRIPGAGTPDFLGVQRYFKPARGHGGFSLVFDEHIGGEGGMDLGEMFRSDPVVHDQESVADLDQPSVKAQLTVA